MSEVRGVHHVTAIAGDPQRNVDFYAGILGLRLVKRTVNFDDPNTYHFYFGDEGGSPGSLLTFFPWPNGRPGRHGAGQVAVTSLAVPSRSIGFWIERLIGHGVRYEGPAKRAVSLSDTEHVISLRDHDGLLLEIVGTSDAEARHGWPGAPGIPVEHALRGVHGVTLWVEDASETESLLTGALGFRDIHESGTTRRFAAGDGGTGTIVDVRAVGGFPRGVDGVGAVHHVAWRVATDDAQLELRTRVTAAGLHATPVIDRHYFRSVYFREPGGVLFEIATDLPGFAVDEPVEHLGERLMLPPHLEPIRARIEATLPPIHLPTTNDEASAFHPSSGQQDVSTTPLGFTHRYLPATGDVGGATLLMLHGTGGDEEDLLPLGRALLPGAALLSPRGKVLERGMPRFFRRIAEGVFDQEDLARRTEELGDFVTAATSAYDLRGDRIIAVGFSNGANIAASLLLRRPGVLHGAVLMSPMVPFEPESPVDLSGTPVFMSAGRLDPIAPPEQVERLAQILRESGADVTVHWEGGGHELPLGAVKAAADWIGNVVGKAR